MYGSVGSYLRSLPPRRRLQDTHLSERGSSFMHEEFPKIAPPPKRSRSWMHASLFAAGLLGGVLFLSARQSPRPEELELQQQLRQLSSQVQQLKQEQAMPAMVLTRYRNSICYIYGV